MQKDNIRKHLWGMEIIWADQDDYKGKILVFEKEGFSTDMHMHKETNKSWFVNAGSVVVRYVDTKDGQTYEQTLNEGDTFFVKALTPVMIQAKTAGASISEVSNQKTEDTFVLAKTMIAKEEQNAQEPVSV
jgi:mannose-6-phosphate isomerase-like protein (cupin superfamily)